ncbi:MAG: nucleotidyltransferase domain-containing protein [Bacteroidota bacterium]
MRLTKKEIIELVRQYLTARQEIVFAYLFGSVVDSDAFKDVDLGVYVGGGISDGFGYAFAMSGELGRMLECHVDVILMNTAPDHLIHSISKGKVILNRDDDARVSFITASWSRYFDIQVKRRDYLRAIAAGSSSHE